MEKLLSAKRVQDIIRSNVNLDYLVPQLVKHGLLTPAEFSDLSDRRVDEEQRINHLIDVLKRKGRLNDQVKGLTTSLEDANEHTGHEDILTIVKEQVILICDAEVTNDMSERKRPWPDDCESDSNKRTKSQCQHKLPKTVTNFIERQDQSQHSIELAKSLQKDDTQVLSIVGMPAVGKSQVAIAIGQCMQQQLKYDVIYHDLVNNTEISEDIFDVNVKVNVNGQCLILDNIDNVLSDTQHTSTFLSSLLHVMRHHCRLKIITTSCKVFGHPELTAIKTVISPFTETESKLYLKTILNGYSEEDIMPVIKVCAGIPLALRCAIENLKIHQWDVQDFCDDEEGLQLLEVESFGSKSLSQVKVRFNNKYSLLGANHQNNMKKVANDPTTLHNLTSSEKRSLHNSGWLLKSQDGNFLLNGLLCAFLREISDHVVNGETDPDTVSP